MAKSVTAKDVHSVLVFQGFITLLFGVAVIFWPGLTVLTLIYLVGAYLLVSGIAHIFNGLSKASEEGWSAIVALLGLVELGFGIYMLRHPTETFTVLIGLIGFILVIRGLVELVGAFFDKGSEETSRGLQAFAGLFAAVVGIIILNQKAAAGIAFVWLLGLYAIIAGIMELMAARSLNE